MEYAKEHNIRHHSAARKASTKKAAPAGRSIRLVDAARQGRARGNNGQTEISPAANAAHTFLKTAFLPKLEAATVKGGATAIQNTENDFYRSLCALAKHYGGFAPLDTRAFGYPYNMTLSVWEAESHLKSRVKNWHSLRLIKDDNGKTFFISEERYNTGTTLYYIPVVPLYKLLRTKKTRKTACLLLSVCSYLYHVADIPYYRQDGTYLYWHYEMIKDWIEQDDDTEYDNRVNELNVAAWVGDRMEQKLFNRKNLEVMEARIKSYLPATDFDWQCLQLAEQAQALYKDYPATSIFEHGNYRLCDSEDEDEEVIRMDKYISFVAAVKGWLYEKLAECVNNEFNEYGSMEEPAIEKRFDGASPVAASLGFEEKLFNLIDGLCYLLDYEKNETS